MMVPTTVVMTVPVAETMKDQRLRNRITAEMTTVVETPAEMKAVAETPAETKAVAETSLTKAVGDDSGAAAEATGTPDAA